MTETDIKTPTVLLTGPTSGIGRRILQGLIEHRRRPHLVLLARDRAGLDAAVAEANHAGATATGITLDLADFDSVRAAAERVAALHSEGRIATLDAVFLNAGAQFTSRTKTGTQGYELTFTVNVMAQHLLLRSLEPLLAPDAQALVMGSSTHRGTKAAFNLVPDPHWQEPAEMARPDAQSPTPVRFSEQRERGGVAYATSKLALVTLAHDWAQRLSASGRRLNIYDPGLVAGTGLGKDMPAYMYWVWKYLMPAMSVLPGATTARVTARHAVELTMGDSHPTLNGGYVEIGRLVPPHPDTFRIERRSALWDWLEGALSSYLPTGVARSDA